jgi:cytidylate kinase
MQYITIEREYGSGGTAIARRLSKETGIPCYGKEILEAAARENNVSPEDITRYEESVTGRFLYSVFAMASMGREDKLTDEGKVFVAEQKIIRNYARQGRAIFLGHCASEALHDFPHVLHVFITCRNEEIRTRRIMDQYGIPLDEVEKTRNRFDRKRANYYKANTARSWHDLSNYDLVMDTGVIDEETGVKILKSCF